MKLRLLARTSSLVRGAAGGGACARPGRGSGRLLFLDGPPGALDGFGQPALVHRLQQVVHGLQPEGFHGVLVVGCHEDEMRQLDVLFPQPPDHAQAVQTRHVDVQKNQFRLQLLDQFDGLQTVGTSCNYFDFREILEQVGKLVAGQLFVIHDNCRESSRRAVSHGVGIIAFRL